MQYPAADRDGEVQLRVSLGVPGERAGSGTPRDLELVERRGEPPGPGGHLLSGRDGLPGGGGGDDPLVAEHLLDPPHHGGYVKGAGPASGRAYVLPS
jgi:hypothetical protein